MTNKILIVDDETELVDVMRTFFQYEGYSVLCAYDGENALKLIDDSVDIVLLDVMMPRLNGLQVCKAIRQKYSTPILFLTAKTGDQDQIDGFLCGADDYVKKPFTLPVLLHRIKALQNRNKMNHQVQMKNILSVGSFSIHLDSNQLFFRSTEIQLTRIEFQLLVYLASRHVVRSLKEMYENVWDEEYSKCKVNTVMVHLNHLKIKLPKKANGESYIKNIWGKGYIFDIEEDTIDVLTKS